ncbi:MAG: cell division protein FtsQ/DivIB [Bradyrhizobiaceae bacterium]|nr:cell division protein FtsQ/DivIB [Bradyrhizobiaceae bacterium]
MDGGGRFAQSLTSLCTPRAVASERRRAQRRSLPRIKQSPARPGAIGALERCLDHMSTAIVALNLPRRSGLAASAVIIVGSIVYGTIRGDHLPAMIATLDDARNSIGNALGLHLTSVALSGQKRLSRDDVLASAGVTDRTSLLFFDVAMARARLESNPWIAEATVQTLYPGRLQISVTEREAFALWQHDGSVFVVSADGTVLEPYTGERFTNLPFVVGRGAQLRAKDFLAVLDHYPEIRDQVRASVLVAERRWNLRTKNGIDVRLPETDVKRAFDELARLERDEKLLSRDITTIDLRQIDRVTVQLSDEAARAREEAQKAKKPKSKAGNA